MGEREVVDRLNAVFVDGEAALDGLRVLQGFFPGQVAPARIVAGLVVGFVRRPVTTGAQAIGGVRGLGGFLRLGGFLLGVFRLGGFRPGGFAGQGRVLRGVRGFLRRLGQRRGLAAGAQGLGAGGARQQGEGQQERQKAFHGHFSFPFGRAGASIAEGLLKKEAEPRRSFLAAEDERGGAGHRGIGAHKLRVCIGYAAPFEPCVLDGAIPVSYTHLDVYKRQVHGRQRSRYRRC